MNVIKRLINLKETWSDLSIIFAAEIVIIDIEEGILEYMVKRQK